MMTMIKLFLAWIQLTYPTRNVETLRNRVRTLASRLEIYAERNVGTDSADRMEIVVKKSRELINEMWLIPDVDKIVHLNKIIKQLKSMTKLNHC